MMPAACWANGGGNERLAKCIRSNSRQKSTGLQNRPRRQLVDVFEDEVLRLVLAACILQFRLVGMKQPGKMLRLDLLHGAVKPALGNRSARLRRTTRPWCTMSHGNAFASALRRCRTSEGAGPCSPRSHEAR